MTILETKLIVFHFQGRKSKLWNEIEQTQLYAANYSYSILKRGLICEAQLAQMLKTLDGSCKAEKAGRDSQVGNEIYMLIKDGNC